MNLTPEESRFLTALAREQNQTGCRGPAHDLLRRHAYPDAPVTGPGSLTFSYEAVPLTSLLVQHYQSLEEIDDFLRREERDTKFLWPWSSAEEYQARIAEARRHWKADEADSSTLGRPTGPLHQLTGVIRMEQLIIK